MNVAERFTLLVKGSVNAVLDSIEDPERSLHQLVLDMDEELCAARHAAARAIAAEDRLNARIQTLKTDAEGWSEGAAKALAAGHEEDARDCLKRAERADRQREVLERQLESQSRDTAEIREQVARLTERVDHARSRLSVLQARLRQGEARRAMGRVLTRVETGGLECEFSRVAERVEEEAAASRALSRLEDEDSGEALRRRVERAMVDHAAEERLNRLKEDLEKRKGAS
jgi:phage shock protein A